MESPQKNNLLPLPSSRVPKKLRLQHISRSKAAVTSIENTSHKTTEPEAVDIGMLLEIDFQAKELVARKDYEMLPTDKRRIATLQQQRNENSTSTKHEIINTPPPIEQKKRIFLNLRQKLGLAGGKTYHKKDKAQTTISGAQPPFDAMDKSFEEELNR